MTIASHVTSTVKRPQDFSSPFPLMTVRQSVLAGSSPASGSEMLEKLWEAKLTSAVTEKGFTDNVCFDSFRNLE